MSDSNIHDYVNERAQRGLGVPLTPPAPLAGGPSGPHTPNMSDDRLKAIDGRLIAIESEQRTHFRWTVTIALALAGLIATTTAFLMTRVDRVEDRLSRLETSVNELPAKIGSNLSQINQTLFQAIQAAKQVPPQVILMTAPRVGSDSGGVTSEPSSGPVPPPAGNETNDSKTRTR